MRKYILYDREEDIARNLKKARQNLSAIDEAIEAVDNIDGFSELNEQEMGTSAVNYNRFQFIMYLLRKYVQPAKIKFCGLTADEAVELLLCAYGLHPDFPPNNYANMVERRVAFANKKGLVKKSTAPKSVDRLLWNKENKIIDYIALNLADSTEPVSKSAWYGNSYSLYDLLKIDELSREQSALQHKIEQEKQVSRWFLSKGRESLAKKGFGSYHNVEALNRTMKAEERKIRKQIRAFLDDPMFVLMFCMAVVDIPYDCFISMPEKLENIDAISAPAIPLHRGSVIGQLYPVIPATINSVEASLDDYSRSGDEECYYTARSKAKNASTISALSELLNSMVFRGIVFARPSKIYSVGYSNKDQHERVFLNSRWSQDWIVFDYYHEGQHTFSLGFVLSSRAIAVFTPLPTLSLFET